MIDPKKYYESYNYLKTPIGSKAFIGFVIAGIAFHAVFCQDKIKDSLAHRFARYLSTKSDY